MKLIELRSAEVDFHASAPHVVALLPIGAVEQHSAHLPLGTDALIAELLAGKIESRAPSEVVLMPTHYVGASDHHLAMPGTVSIGTVATAQSIANQCTSLARSSGITRFFILNGHGGNQPAERLALELIATAELNLLAFAADYWSLMFARMDADNAPRPSAMGHADLIETSILLAARPELVRLDLATADDYADGLPDGVFTTLGIPERTEHGGVGDPTTASPEYGRACIESAVGSILRAIQNVASLQIDAIP